MTPVLRGMAVAAATGACLSYLPATVLKGRSRTGAGLIGALWGVVALAVMPSDPVKQLLAWLGLCAIAVVIAEIAEDSLARHDDPRIVIDETLGYLAATLFLPRTFAVLAATFVLFRLLDTLKPGWIRRAGNLPGGWGIILDDVLAGIVANLMVWLALRIHPF